MKNNITVLLDEKLKVTELVAEGNTLDEIKTSIAKQVEARMDTLMRELEIVAAKGRPGDIVAYNNALQVRKFAVTEMINKFTEQAEAIWRFQETLR